jgi:hypothetical protein
LTHKDFVALATQACAKIDLIPFYPLQNLAKKEKMRHKKIIEAFKEAIYRLQSPPSDDQTTQITSRLNMVMASSTLNICLQCLKNGCQASLTENAFYI